MLLNKEKKEVEGAYITAYKEIIHNELRPKKVKVKIVTGNQNRTTTNFLKKIRNTDEWKLI